MKSVSQAICIPHRMSYIASMFMQCKQCNRPLPVPRESKNLGFFDQFVPIPGDVFFAVEYAIRAAQMSVYFLLSIDRPHFSGKAARQVISSAFSAVVMALD